VMKLYSYQKKLLNSKCNKVLMNWCRGAGSDTALASYILEQKPQNTLLLGDSFEYRGLIESLRFLSKDYNVTVETKDKFNYLLTFTQTDKTIFIKGTYKISDNFKYDLIINKCNWNNDPNEELFSKYILSLTINNSNLNGKYNDFDKIIVDHKMMLKEDITNLDSVLFSAINSKNFYREYAILDKPKENEISFSDFQQKALQSLQKQFLNTRDSHDTVLTRKNIIEMIKDLKQLGMN
jgi:hypothetical protein